MRSTGRGDLMFIHKKTWCQDWRPHQVFDQWLTLIQRSFSLPAKADEKHLSTKNQSKV